jgi:serine protease Do
MQIPVQYKTFLLGLSVSALILVSFFGGAIADRVFVIKPLDFLVPATGSRLQTSSNPKQSSPLSGDTSVPDIAEATADSVVTISITQTRRVIEPNSLDLFGFIIPDLGTNQQLEKVQQDIGTGFAVEGGFIITNRHVVSEADAQYTVIDNQEREHKVTNIYRDPSNDLAILKIEEDQLPPLPLGNSDQIRVGEGVIAIGNALGEFRHTVTTGVVSGLSRGIEAFGGGSFESLDGVIQTDAAINPGNSGGPLINLQGQVIGVNVAVSAVGENIGFAIPINVVKASLDNFNQTGQFERAFLGVQYRMISAEAAKLNSVPEGALVVEVVADSAASKAGLEPGDIITKFAGQTLTEDSNLGALINQQKLGDTVDLTYWREGSEQQVKVTFLK